MSVFGRMMLIKHFEAYLLHYLYNLKTMYDSRKLIVELECTSKNTSIKNIIKNNYRQ